MSKDETTDDFDEEFDFIDEDDFANDKSEETNIGNTSSTAAMSKHKKLNKKLLMLAGGALTFVILLTVVLKSGKEETNTTNTHASIPNDKNIAVAPKPAQTTDDDKLASNLQHKETATEDHTAAAVNKTPIDNELVADANKEDIAYNSKDDEFSDLFAEAHTEKNREGIAELLGNTKGKINVAKADDMVINTPEIKISNSKKGEDHELQTSLDSITEEITENVNQIKQLEESIYNMNQTLYKINQTMEKIDNKVLGLGDTVDNLSLDLAKVKKLISEDDIDLLPAKEKKEQPKVGPSYVVHAIIPGRAWLKSSSGQIITVAEGDTLDAYGSIALIDAANSMVRTSSGIVFK